MRPLAVLLLGHLSCSLCSRGDEEFSRPALQKARAPLAQRSRLTFVFGFPGALKVPPLCSDEATQLAEGEVGVLGFDDGSHLAAEEDVAAHVDLALGALLLRQAFDGFGRALRTRRGHIVHKKAPAQLSHSSAQSADLWRGVRHHVHVAGHGGLH